MIKFFQGTLLVACLALLTACGGGDDDGGNAGGGGGGNPDPDPDPNTDLPVGSFRVSQINGDFFAAGPREDSSAVAYTVVDDTYGLVAVPTRPTGADPTVKFFSLAWFMPNRKEYTRLVGAAVFDLSLNEGRIDGEVRVSRTP
jgi:hypothetical protein